MNNFTTEHLETIVNYVENKFDIIDAGLKETAEKITKVLGEEKIFFEGKEISSSIAIPEQKKLELALRFVALDDEEAIDELNKLNKNFAKKLAFEQGDLFYEYDDYFTYLYRCLTSLLWVNVLGKQNFDQVVQKRITGTIIRDKQKREVGTGGSDKDVELLNALKKRFDGDMYKIVDLTYEEFRAIFPHRAIKCYNNVIGLAKAQMGTSLEGLIAQAGVSEDKFNVGSNYNQSADDLQEGLVNTFRNAVDYTQTIIGKAEAMKQSGYANTYRVINLGYQMLLDVYANYKTEEECTAYYSKYYAKIWADHSYKYFARKAIEDFKEHWNFYTDGDTEAASYIKYLIRENAVA